MRPATKHSGDGRGKAVRESTSSSPPPSPSPSWTDRILERNQKIRKRRFPSPFYILSSKYFWWKILFCIRASILALLPPAALIADSTTTVAFFSKSFATTAALLSSNETLGASLMTGYEFVKAALFAIPLLTLFIGVGMPESGYAWSVVFVAIMLIASFIHDGVSRKLSLLLFNSILITMAKYAYDGNVGPGNKLVFPIRLMGEFAIGGVCGVFSTLIPFPKLAGKRADNKMKAAATSLSLCFDGLCDTFFCENNLQRRVNMVHIQCAQRQALAMLDDIQMNVFLSRFEPQSLDAYYLRLAKGQLLASFPPLVDATMRVLEAVGDDPFILHGSSQARAFGEQLGSDLKSLASAVEEALNLIGGSTDKKKFFPPPVAPSTAAVFANRHHRGQRDSGKVTGGNLHDTNIKESTSWGSFFVALGKKARRSCDEEQLHTSQTCDSPDAATKDYNFLHPFHKVHFALAALETTFARARRDIYFTVQHPSFMGSAPTNVFEPVAGSVDDLPIRNHRRVANMAKASTTPQPQQRHAGGQTDGTTGCTHNNRAQNGRNNNSNDNINHGDPNDIDDDPSMLAGRGTTVRLKRGHHKSSVGEASLASSSSLSCSSGGDQSRRANTKTHDDNCGNSSQRLLNERAHSIESVFVYDIAPGSQEFGALMAFYLFTLSLFGKKIVCLPEVIEERRRGKTYTGVIWEEIFTSMRGVVLSFVGLIAFITPRSWFPSITPQQSLMCAIKFRESFKIALAMGLSQLFYYYTDRRYAFMAGPQVLCFVVSNTSSEAVYASVMRLFGTLFGGIVGFFFARITYTPTDRVIALICVMFFFNFFRTGKQYGGAAVYAGVVLVTMLSPTITSGEAISRMSQVTFAVVIYTFITILLFPTQPLAELAKVRIQGMERMRGSFKGIMECFAAPLPCEEEYNDDDDDEPKKEGGCCRQGDNSDGGGGRREINDRNSNNDNNGYNGNEPFATTGVKHSTTCSEDAGGGGGGGVLSPTSSSSSTTAAVVSSSYQSHRASSPPSPIPRRNISLNPFEVTPPPFFAALSAGVQGPQQQLNTLPQTTSKKNRKKEKEGKHGGVAVVEPRKRAPRHSEQDGHEKCSCSIREGQRARRRLFPQQAPRWWHRLSSLIGTGDTVIDAPQTAFPVPSTPVAGSTFAPRSTQQWAGASNILGPNPIDEFEEEEEEVTDSNVGGHDSDQNDETKRRSPKNTSDDKNDRPSKRRAKGTTTITIHSPPEIGLSHEDLPKVKPVKTHNKVRSSSSSSRTTITLASSSSSSTADPLLTAAAQATRAMDGLIAKASAWMPLAETEPTISRVPYPTAASKEHQQTIRRMRSLLELMVEALRVLRSRGVTATYSEKCRCSLAARKRVLGAFIHHGRGEGPTLTLTGKEQTNLAPKRQPQEEQNSDSSSCRKGTNKTNVTANSNSVCRDWRCMCGRTVKFHDTRPSPFLLAALSDLSPLASECADSFATVVQLIVVKLSPDNAGGTLGLAQARRIKKCFSATCCCGCGTKETKQRGKGERVSAGDHTGEPTTEEKEAEDNDHGHDDQHDEDDPLSFLRADRLISASLKFEEQCLELHYQKTQAWQQLVRLSRAVYYKQLDAYVRQFGPSVVARHLRRSNLVPKTDEDQSSPNDNVKVTKKASRRSEGETGDTCCVEGRLGEREGALSFAISGLDCVPNDNAFFGTEIASASTACTNGPRNAPDNIHSNYYISGEHYGNDGKKMKETRPNEHEDNAAQHDNRIRNRIIAGTVLGGTSTTTGAAGTGGDLDLARIASHEAATRLCRGQRGGLAHLSDAGGILNGRDILKVPTLVNPASTNSGFRPPQASSSSAATGHPSSSSSSSSAATDWGRHAKKAVPSCSTPTASTTLRNVRCDPTEKEEVEDDITMMESFPFPLFDDNFVPRMLEIIQQQVAAETVRRSARQMTSCDENNPNEDAYQRLAARFDLSEGRFLTPVSTWTEDELDFIAERLVRSASNKRPQQPSDSLSENVHHGIHDAEAGGCLPYAPTKLKMPLSNVDSESLHTFTFCLVMFSKEAKRLIMSVEGLQQHMLALE